MLTSPVQSCSLGQKEMPILPDDDSRGISKKNEGCECIEALRCHSVKGQNLPDAKMAI